MTAARLSTSRIELEGIKDFAFSEPVPPPELTYREWFRREILPSQWMTCFTAFFVHWIALLALAAIYCHVPIDFPPVTLNAVISDTEPLESSAMEIQTTDVDLHALEDSTATPETVAMSISTMIPIPETDALNVMPDSLAALALQATASESAEKSAGQPKQAAVLATTPKNAVSEGSFSIWTEPDNPDPGEPYKIVVQIRLPEGMERYSLADLEGVVVGSDGYQKLIPGNLRGFVPVHERQARFEIHIVSADENVQDTVFVRSKLLREAQKLQLRF